MLSDIEREKDSEIGKKMERKAYGERDGKKDGGWERNRESKRDEEI